MNPTSSTAAAGPSAYDIAVIGAGAVGMSIAIGLLQRGLTVCVVDEGDFSFRASRGNFGLVWVQGKGARNGAYGHWTLKAAAQWPAFAETLLRLTEVDVGLSDPGGLTLCLDEKELATRVEMQRAMQALCGSDFSYEVLSAAETRERLPDVSAHIAGAVFCPLDRHVNPLKLMSALFHAHTNSGGAWLSGHAVREIASEGRAGFRLNTATTSIRANKVVLAAGLGNRALACRLGLNVPVRPVRGQVLITERTPAFLKYPTLHVRQTVDGTVQIGDSKEEVGFDDHTTMAELSRIADRAIRCFPSLANVNIIRSWGALRVMSQDGYPIYSESSRRPGLYLATCHSGITLAPVHASLIAGWIAGDQQPADISAFDLARFKCSNT